MITAYTFPYDSIKDRIIITCKVSLPDSDDSSRSLSRALWDTGATKTCISINLANELGLSPIDRTKVVGANNEPFFAPVFCVQLRMGSFLIPIQNVIGLPMDGTDRDLIIGMDIISKGDLSITNYSGRTVITFRTPSLETINYVDELNLQNKCDKMHILNLKNNRQDKCACGSGRDYKNCHGSSPYSNHR